ncbi:MAG: DoxX family membrane protein [Bdellovibrionota bacterium]
MNKKIAFGARILLGLIYFIFGLNGLFNFLPMTPPPMPEAAMAFFGGIMKTGYFMPVLKVTETICGALLLSGFAAPLALVILAPITLQIFLFHSMLTPGLGNIVMPLVMAVMHVVAATAYWHLYRPLFTKGNRV